MLNWGLGGMAQTAIDESHCEKNDGKVIREQMEQCEELLEGMSTDMMNEEMYIEHEVMGEETEVDEDLVERTAEEMTNEEKHIEEGEIISEEMGGDEELLEFEVVSKDMNEELPDEEKEVMRDVTEQDEDFLEGTSNENNEEICDEELRSSVRVLTHELELKEIEIGGLQIENKTLLQENNDLKEDNLELKNQLYGLQTASFITHTHMTAANLFGTHSLQNDDRKVLYYTGLPPVMQSLMGFIIFWNHFYQKIPVKAAVHWPMSYWLSL